MKNRKLFLLMVVSFIFAAFSAAVNASAEKMEIRESAWGILNLNQPDIIAVLPLIFDQAETRVCAVRALEIRVLNDRQHGIFRSDAPVQF